MIIGKRQIIDPFADGFFVRPAINFFGTFVPAFNDKISTGGEKYPL